jgi:hypothetical protein
MGGCLSLASALSAQFGASEYLSTSSNVKTVTDNEKQYIFGSEEIGVLISLSRTLARLAQ